MAKKICKECGAFMVGSQDLHFMTLAIVPIWRCQNCRHTLPRRVLNTKKKRERQERFERIAATLEGGAQ